MLQRVKLLVLPVLFIYWVFSSLATASEEPDRLKVQSQGFESSRGLTLAAAEDEDTAAQDFSEVPQSRTQANFESAFQKYLTRPWSLMIYQGFGTSTDLGQTLLFDIKSEDSLFTGLVANRKMFSFWRYFTFELEGQVLRHYRKQEHWEYNGLFVIRFHPFLLDPTIDIEFAAGEGLSYANHIPVIEDEQHPDAASRFLNYLFFEVSFTHVQHREWSLVTRIHHRSGAFGLFNGTRGGSNFLALGLRHHF
jgi:hypothetical protein